MSWCGGGNRNEPESIFALDMDRGVVCDSRATWGLHQEVVDGDVGVQGGCGLFWSKREREKKVVGGDDPGGQRWCSWLESMAARHGEAQGDYSVRGRLREMRLWLVKEKP